MDSVMDMKRVNGRYGHALLSNHYCTSLIAALFGVLSYSTSCNAGSSNIDSLRALTAERGCIDNDVLVEICKEWTFIDNSEDHEALSTAFAGEKVCIIVEAKEYSSSKKRFTGQFTGNSGAFGGDFILFVDLGSEPLKSGIGKGDRVMVSGRMPAFSPYHNNVIDNCFLELSDASVEKDGF